MPKYSIDKIGNQSLYNTLIDKIMGFFLANKSLIIVSPLSKTYFSLHIELASTNYR